MFLIETLFSVYVLPEGVSPGSDTEPQDLWIAKILDIGQEEEGAPVSIALSDSRLESVLTLQRFGSKPSGITAGRRSNSSSRKCKMFGTPVIGNHSDRCSEM